MYDDAKILMDQEVASEIYIDAHPAAGDVINIMFELQCLLPSMFNKGRFRGDVFRRWPITHSVQACKFQPERGVHQ